MNKTKFGVKQLGNPTPSWARIAFRIVVVLTSVAVFIVANTSTLTGDQKTEVAVWLKGLDMLALGLSQLFGIEPSAPFGAKNSTKQ